MGKLDGKVAIVTGAASGIGPSYAQGLAAEGAKVMVADVEPGDATVRAITSAGGVAQSRICDVSDAAQVEALIRDTEKAFGGVHILVNNAAVFARFVAVPLDQISAADWERAFAVNVRGSYLTVRAALPIMRRQGYGKVINIASGTVFKGVPMMLHYVSTKGAIIAMTRAMASELGGDGIRVNAIAPGLTSTEY
jgi:NAD(P)-dependent dehydrogenase (short-subunit alcohol dehydrogenase family)